MVLFIGVLAYCQVSNKCTEEKCELQVLFISTVYYAELMCLTIGAVVVLALRKLAHAIIQRFFSAVIIENFN